MEVLVLVIVLLPFLLVTIAIGFLIYIAVTGAGRRRRQLEEAAQQLRHLGYSVVPEIPQPPAFPFNEFKNTGGDVTLHMTQPGTYDSAFHYTYVTGSGDDKTTVRLSCAVVPVPFFIPPVSIWRGGRSILGSMMGNRIDTDSERFNALYEVECDNERLAYTLLSYELIDWLLAEPAFSSGATFRFSGSWLMLVRSVVETHELPGMLIMAQMTRDRLPKVMASLYPVPQ